MPINQLLFPITFFIAVGALLDRIVEPSKKELPAGEVRGSTVSGSLKIVFSALFSGYFGGRFFSLKYFVRVGMISMTALILIILFTDPSFFGELRTLDGYAGYLVFAYCLIINTFIDAVSLRVTKTFIFFVTLSRGWFNYFVAILSDIAVSLLIFTYLAGFFVVAALSFETWRLNFKIEETLVQPSIFVSKVGIGPSSVQVDSWLSIVKSGQSHNLTPFQDGDFFSGTPSYLKGQFSIDQTVDFSAIGSFSDSFIIDKVSLKFGYPDSSEQMVIPVSENNVSAAMNVLSKQIFNGPDGLYEVAFFGHLKELDTLYGFRSGIGGIVGPLSAMQGELLNILSGQVAVVLAKPSQLTSSFTPFGSEVVCFVDIDGERLIVALRNLVDPSMCKGRGIGQSGRVQSTMEFYRSVLPESFAVLPVSAMMLTSLFFTAFLYLAVFTMVMVNLLSPWMSLVGSRLPVYFSRAPFAVGGLVLGCIVSLASFLFQT